MGIRSPSESRKRVIPGKMLQTGGKRGGNIAYMTVISTGLKTRIATKNVYSFNVFTC
jgi:hypothetical protein